MRTKSEKLQNEKGSLRTLTSDRETLFQELLKEPRRLGLLNKANENALAQVEPENRIGLARTLNELCERVYRFDRGAATIRSKANSKGALVGLHAEMASSTARMGLVRDLRRDALEAIGKASGPRALAKLYLDYAMANGVIRSGQHKAFMSERDTSRLVKLASSVFQLAKIKDEHQKTLSTDRLTASFIPKDAIRLELKADKERLLIDQEIAKTVQKLLRSVEA